MLNYNLLKELIPYLERYQKEGNNGNVEEFLLWSQNSSMDSISNIPDESVQVPLQGDVDAKITQLITLLYKYVRFYFKKGLKDTLLNTTEDFGFLATLAMQGDLKKNELIQKNTCEFTSGMEVIRRLERNELICSFMDLEDKRAKRVKITEKGFNVFYAALPVLNQIGTIAVGNLSEIEQDKLMFLLQKLNAFHNPVFHKEKISNLSDIVEKYVEK